MGYRNAQEIFPEGLLKQIQRYVSGENQLDLSVVNSMLMKQKARLDAAAKAKEETKVQMEVEKHSYDITIHWRMTAEQFLGRKTEASA